MQNVLRTKQEGQRAKFNTQTRGGGGGRSKTKRISGNVKKKKKKKIVCASWWYDITAEKDVITPQQYFTEQNKKQIKVIDCESGDCLASIRCLQFESGDVSSQHCNFSAWKSTRDSLSSFKLVPRPPEIFPKLSGKTRIS